MMVWLLDRDVQNCQGEIEVKSYACFWRLAVRAAQVEDGLVQAIAIVDCQGAWETMARLVCNAQSTRLGSSCNPLTGEVG